MKLKRMVACILTLLLVVSLLPIGAMAEETVNEESNVTLDKNYDKNTGTNVTIPENITVGTNEGIVGETGDLSSGNFGTIGTNRGIIDYNYGLVEHNQGENTDKGAVTSIKLNAGTVTSNECVLIEGSDGKMEPAVGAVQENIGKIGTNNGIVYNNALLNPSDSTQGVIDENRCLIYSNSGTVKTNGLQWLDQNGNAIVIDGKTAYGMIAENYGTVETNAIDGVVNNSRRIREEESPDKEDPNPTQIVLEGKVENNFGTVVDITNPDNPVKYYGLSWGDDIQNLTLLKGDVEAGTTGINLDDYAATATRSGYKMTGYTAFARNNGKDEEITGDATNHLMNAPVWLQILWEKLGGKSESKAMVANVPTHVAAGDVKEGTLVRCGNMVFLVIEVGEDYILVTTMSAQSKKDTEDPMAYLAKYLTPEQLVLLQGNPEQLSEELAAKFFGGNTNHIVFKAAKNLFA